VTVAEAALGAEVKVPAPRGGQVTVKIPQGTQNGMKLLVRGKGVRRKDGTNGNLLVTIDVMVPQDLNGKARSAIEDLRDATAGPDPREELLARAMEA
jgi:molecular chaperone DnaJ